MLVLKKNRGFSLIEVLVALAIFATGIIFVLRSFSVSLAATKFSQNITLACFASENTLWEIENNFRFKLDQPLSGTVKEGDAEFDWSSSFPLTQAQSGIQEIDFDISQKDQFAKPGNKLNFIYFLPDNS